VVADTLSQKSLHASAMMIKELKLIERLKDLTIAIKIGPNSIRLRMLKVTNEFLQQVQVAQG